MSFSGTFGWVSVCVVLTRIDSVRCWVHAMSCDLWLIPLVMSLSDLQNQQQQQQQETSLFKYIQWHFIHSISFKSGPSKEENTKRQE